MAGEHHDARGVVRAVLVGRASLVGLAGVVLINDIFLEMGEGNRGIH